MNPPQVYICSPSWTLLPPPSPYYPSGSSQYSHVRLFATPWTVAYQAPPSMEFSRQEYWSGLPFPSPEDLPNPGIKPRSPPLQADAFTIWATREAYKWKSLSHVQLFVTPWTVAHQAPLSMKFSRQEYWSGLPFLPPADLPNPGIEPVPLASPTLAGRFFTTKPLGKQWVQLMGWMRPPPAKDMVKT